MFYMNEKTNVQWLCHITVATYLAGIEPAAIWLPARLLPALPTELRIRKEPALRLTLSIIVPTGLEPAYSVYFRGSQYLGMNYTVEYD